MRFPTLSLLVALAIAPAPGFAADAGQSSTRIAVDLGSTALADQTAYATLESLTTEIGPRLAGTDAMARAADWAETKLKALGLADVHREPFQMTAWLRGTEDASVVSPAPQRLVVTALGNSVATPSEGITAPIVLFRTYDALLAAEPGALTGKIAVVTQRMARTQEGGGYGGNYMMRAGGASEAAKRGAIAYVIRSLGTDSHRFPHAGHQMYANGVPKIPAAALSNPDADQLERLAARGPVTLHLLLTPTSKDVTSWNVAGEVKGREKPDETVLIGAHLDSWDLGTGAIDDGAGVAITSTVAGLIAHLPHHPRRTIRVVLFGGEELSQSGVAYGKAHAAEAPNIAVMAECDFGADRVFSVQLPGSVAAGPFGTSLGAALAPLTVYIDPRPTERGGSDLGPLHEAGAPVLYLHQDGTRYFDIHHTADDTLDKVDPKELAQAVAAWTETIYLAAEEPVEFRAPLTK